LQHVKIIDYLKKYLGEKGYNVLVGKPSYKAMFPGQVLGCEYSSLINVMDKIDAVLVVAGGYFHALGAYLVSGKPVFIYDPYRGVIEDYTREAYKVLARRYYLVEEIRNGLYRDFTPDVLISVDGPMMHEVYQSGYADKNELPR
jgi:2-(3-amino-3-carboxypropyl)histidine synthase